MFPSIRAERITALAGPAVNVILLCIQFFWKNEIFMTSNLFMFLINVLPVLPLDGGRIIFLIIEMVRRKPLKKEIEATINTVGLLLLLGLMMFVTLKDVINLF